MPRSVGDATGAERLIEAIEQATLHAERCTWPECACQPHEPDKVRCAESGCLIWLRNTD